MWILTQMKRWGQIKGDVDYAGVAKQVFLATDTTKLMKEVGLTPPAATSEELRRDGQDLRSREAGGVREELRDQAVVVMLSCRARTPALLPRGEGRVDLPATPATHCAPGDHDASLTLRAALVSVRVSLSRVASRHARHRHRAADGSRIRQADGADGDAGQIRDARPARCRREAVGARAPAVLRQRPERQGRRHPACVFDRARRARLSARRAGRDPDRLPDRHVAAVLEGARPVHPGAQTDLAARLDAARALHHQGFQRSRRSSSSSSARSGRC